MIQDVAYLLAEEKNVLFHSSSFYLLTKFGFEQVYKNRAPGKVQVYYKPF